MQFPCSFTNLLCAVLCFLPHTLLAFSILTPELAKRVISAAWILTTTASENQLYVYTSDDGINFSPWKTPAWSTSQGSLKDPSWILNVRNYQDQNYFVAYSTGDNQIGLAKSKTMLTWDFVGNVSTNTNEFNVYKAMAPEFFDDPVTQQITIIVSLATEADGPLRPHILTATDLTLASWTEPVLLEGFPETGAGYTDSFPIYYNGQYHLFTRSITTNFIEHAIAPSIMGPFTFVQTGDFAGWGQAYGPAVTTGVTGSTGGFRLFAGGHTAGSHFYVESSDLFNWTIPKIGPQGLSSLAQPGTIRQQY